MKEDKRKFISPNRQRIMQSRMLAANVVYRVLNVAVVFILTVLLSRLMGVAGYGLLSLLIANVSIFNLLSAFGADAGITYHAASGNLSAGKLISFLLAIVLFQVLILSVIEMVSYCISGHLLLFRTDHLRYGWLGIVFLAGVSLVEKYTALFYGKQLFSLSNKALLSSNLLMLVLFASWWLSDSGRPVIFYLGAYVLLNFSQAIFLIITYHVFAKNPFTAKMPGKKDAAVFFSYSLFTVVINSIQFLAYRVDYWILDYYRGNQELGWYSLAVKLSQLLWVLPLLFASIIFPQVASNRKEYDETRMKALIRGMNGLNIIAGLLLFLTAAFFIPLLFGKEFYNSIMLFRILLPGVILFCVATVLAAYFAGQNKLRINFGGSLLCFFVIITLDLLLIPSMGRKGAAIASSIGYSITGLYFIAMYCFSKKTAITRLFIPEANDWKYVVNLFRRDLTKK